MTDELEQLENLIKEKNEEGIINFTLERSNDQRVKIRADYQTKFSRDLLEDFNSNLKSDFSNVVQSLYKDPVENDADLFYQAMKGAGSDEELITELLCFRKPEQINKVKAKFQEKYGKELVAEIKSETSGDYEKMVVSLLEGTRGTNSSPDKENCVKIAKEIYDAGEGKIGTNEDIFIKYFTTLSKEELLLVCKEYEKNHKKHILDSIEGEFDSHEKDFLKIVLYAMYSPYEYYAKQIHSAIEGAGTADNKLIRCILAGADLDMKKIKKYYKKIFQKEMTEDIKDDLSGSYEKIIERLIEK